MAANRGNTCSESGSSAEPVKFIRLSFFLVKLFHGCTTMQFLSPICLHRPHRYDEPSRASDQRMCHDWAAVANADRKTNRLLPRFPLPAVSIRPRGLTQCPLAVYALQSPCLWRAWVSWDDAWTVTKTSVHTRGTDRQTTDRQWVSYYLSPNNWRTCGFRSDGCGNVEVPVQSRISTVHKAAVCGQSSHDLFARLPLPPALRIPDVKNWCGSSRVWVRCEATRRTYKQELLSLSRLSPLPPSLRSSEVCTRVCRVVRSHRCGHSHFRDFLSFVRFTTSLPFLSSGFLFPGLSFVVHSSTRPSLPPCTISSLHRPCSAWTPTR